MPRASAAIAMAGVAEARQLQKDQYAQQQLLAQKIQALEAAQTALSSSERANETLEQRCHTLQGEVARLGEASDIQVRHMQSLKGRLVEATTQLKLLGHAPPADSDGASST